MKIPIRHIDVAVILDADLAAIHGVPTKRRNEQVKRNKERFPADFVFRLTSKECREVRANSTEVSGQEQDKLEMSQIATGSNRVRLRDQIARPYAFTEHGALAGNEAIFRRLAEIDKALLLHDRGLRDLYRKLLPLLQSPPDAAKRELGFHVRERTATYRVKRCRP